MRPSLPWLDGDDGNEEEDDDDVNEVADEADLMPYATPVAARLRARLRNKRMEDYRRLQEARDRAALADAEAAWSTANAGR